MEKVSQLKERSVNMKTKLLLLPISLLFLLSGCANSKTEKVDSTTNESTNLISLSENFISISEERTHQLTATINPSLNRYLRFWSSDNEDIATVDENGMVSAVKKGNTIVVLQVGQYFARCAVEVTDYSPNETLSVAFSKDHYNLNVNDEYVLSPVIKFGNEVINNYQITFESSNANVATYLAESSSIKAVGPGECDILFTFAYLTYSVKELIYVNVYE